MRLLRRNKQRMYIKNARKLSQKSSFVSMSLLDVYHVNEVKDKNLKTWKWKTANQRCRNKRLSIEKVLN